VVDADNVPNFFARSALQASQRQIGPSFRSTSSSTFVIPHRQSDRGVTIYYCYIHDSDFGIGYRLT